MSKQVIFHGGCLGCNSQEAFGLQRCDGCCYRHADWNLPRLCTNIQVQKVYPLHTTNSKEYIESKLLEARLNLKQLEIVIKELENLNNK